jgi:hypothetical protein
MVSTERKPILSSAALPGLTRLDPIGYRTATAWTVIVIGQTVIASRPRLALVTD